MDAVAASAESATPKWMLWTGRVMTALPALGLVMSAVMKFSGQQELVQNFTGHLGYPASALVPIGIVEVVCIALYVLPQTATLGAVLLTGYLGGAVATHVRAGDPASELVGSIMLGVFVWGGLFLRDSRLRALFPLRK